MGNQVWVATSVGMFMVVGVVVLQQSMIIIQNQLMKSSYNRLMQKPRTAQVSKKNSSISSVLYKEIGDTLKQYKDNKLQTRRDRDRGSRNSNHNILERENNVKASNQQVKTKDLTRQYERDEGKKSQPMPFTQLNNNYFKDTEEEQASNYSFMFDQKKSIKNIVSTHQETLKEYKNNQTTKTSKKSFQYKYIIGKGGFGKVWKVQHNKTRNQYAMKEMLKSLVMTKKSVQSVMNQRTLLSGLSSPFIVNMHYAFQDRDTLYLVLDLLEGGDLRHHISTKKFSQIQSKFFISCIILGLQYLHNNKIIHRDIKPENLVLDSRGYVRITDLGIARIKKLNNSCDTSGTPGYMSPQVICRMNHSFVSDFYALGVIAYELATGKRPYNGISRNQIREQILAKQATIKPHQIPEDWNEDCIDFINRLLQRKPEQRLGFNGIDQLKNHPWIRDLNWKKMALRDIESPFIPLMKKSDFDQDEQITIEDEEEAEMIEKNSLLLRKTEFQELFRLYYYEPNSQTLQKEKVATFIKNDSHKSPVAEQNRRKNSAGSYHQNMISIKNSCTNLKKTNVSTNNSIQIHGNGSGSINKMKTPQISSRNLSGNLHKKTDITNRNSRQNGLNVSQCVEAYGLSQKYGKERQKQKQRTFFRH